MSPLVLYWLGLFCALWGAFLWIPFGLGLTLDYPGLLHPDIMMGGFLFSFAAAFLMTAVPRLTGTAPAKRWETGAALGLGTGLLLTDLVAFLRPAWRRVELGFALVSILFLGRFCLARFAGRRVPVGPGAVFLGTGLLCGVAGAALLAGAEAGAVSDESGLLGRALFYHGMILALVLGIGWRGGRVRGAVAGALLFLVSFPLEAFSSEIAGRGLRATVATVVAVRFWRWRRQMVAAIAFPPFVRLAGSLLLVGLWLHALVPGYAVHGVHIAFIGGFSLMAFMAAPRPALSRRAADVPSRALRWAVYLLLLAMIVRFTSPWTAPFYVAHLAFAAMTWILALAFWAFFFARTRGVSPPP